MKPVFLECEEKTLKHWISFSCGFRINERHIMVHLKPGDIHAAHMKVYIHAGEEAEQL